MAREENSYRFRGAMFRGGVDPGGPSNGTGGPPPPTRPPPLSNDITLTFVRLAFEPNQSERTVNALDYDAIFRAIMDAGNELYPAWDGEENREEIYCLKYADTELRFHVESIAAENKVNKRADIMRFMEAGTQFWADPQKINPFRVFLLKDYNTITMLDPRGTTENPRRLDVPIPTMVNPERFNQSMFNFRAALRSLFNYSGTLNEERWTNIDWEFVTARHANDVNQYRSMADCQEFFMTVLAILGDSHIITITPQRITLESTSLPPVQIPQWADNPADSTMAPNDLETLRVAIRDELNQWREQRPGNEQDARPANELLADLHLAMTEERDEGRNAVARVQALLHRRSRNDDPLGNNDPDPDARPPTVEGTRHPLGDTETESVCPEPTGDRSASSVERRRPRPPRTGATGANQATGQGQSTGTNQANNNGDGNGDGDDDDGDYPDNNAMLTELLEQSDGEIKQAFPSSGQFCDQCGKSWRGNGVEGILNHLYHCNKVNKNTLTKAERDGMNGTFPGDRAWNPAYTERPPAVRGDGTAWENDAVDGTPKWTKAWTKFEKTGKRRVPPGDHLEGAVIKRPRTSRSSSGSSSLT